MAEFKGTPGPWQACHRHCDATGSEDEMSGLGWDVDGPPAPMLRGMFSLAADAKLIAAAPDLLAALTAPLWLVWSNEHTAWWGPNNAGYYTDIGSAGRYTLEDAIANCFARSQTPGKRPTEMIQPAPEWFEARKAAIAKATA